MEKHFMLDIEATGVDLVSDDLLEIGCLEVDFDKGYWHPGRVFHELMHTEREPTSSFAKEHMADLYERCRKAPLTTPERVRHNLTSFFARCGGKAPDIYVMGWNASNYDVPFLQHREILLPSGYVPGPDGKDQRVGDTHYRIYEMGGAVSFAQNVLQMDRTELLEEGLKAYPELVLPPGLKEHDAIFDCYKQLRQLNGLLRLVRKTIANRSYEFKEMA